MASRANAFLDESISTVVAPVGEEAGELPSDAPPSLCMHCGESNLGFRIGSKSLNRSVRYKELVRLYSATMGINQVQYTETRDITLDSILALYGANGWSAAEKPQQLYSALMASHSLVSAWDEGKLVGLGNAITDGYLVVYYPHLLVLPQYQRYGIGSTLMRMLVSKSLAFHQQILVADNRAVEFYKKCGFERAGMTESMWIYQGKDRDNS